MGYGDELSERLRRSAALAHDLTARTDPTRHIERVDLGPAADIAFAKLDAFNDAVANAAAATGLTAEMIRSDAIARAKSSPFSAIDCVCEIVARQAGWHRPRPPIGQFTDDIERGYISSASAAEKLFGEGSEVAKVVENMFKPSATIDQARLQAEIERQTHRETIPGLKLETLAPDEKPVPFKHPGFLNVIADAKSAAANTGVSDLHMYLNRAQCRALVDGVEALRAKPTEVPGAYKQAFEDLRDECQKLDTALQAEQCHAAKLSHDLANAKAYGRESQKRYIDARRARQVAERDANDARDEFRDDLERDRALAAAAKQFRMITGDFPGLTGPLVDLFKDVK